MTAIICIVGLGILIFRRCYPLQVGRFASILSNHAGYAGLAASQPAPLNQQVQLLPADCQAAFPVSVYVPVVLVAVTFTLKGAGCEVAGPAWLPETLTNHLSGGGSSCGR